MIVERVESRFPKEIPMEPFYYSFLLDSIPDKKYRKGVKSALDKYNSACLKAFKVLQRDLDKCKKAMEAGR